ncbi:hypothetical protein [Micromonospora sp. NPDC049891]|uniref:hypothetical protein n=1 Tax=Micromonospora sp. NPDC049891 TaxID=3155655 RepID=UPI0033D621B0
MNPSEPPTPGAQRQGWLERRRDKVRAEIERNRRGEYTVPTWVLALALALIVGAWIALVIFA